MQTAPSAAMAKTARKKTTDAAAKKAADGLENLTTGQGGSRDSRAAGARSFVHYLRTYEELLAAYESNWLCGQIVDIPAFEMTRAGRTYAIDDPKKLQAITREERRLNLWERVREALTWRSLMGGGALLLSVKGTGDWGVPLVPEAVKLGSLEWIHALDASTLYPFGGQDALLIQDPTLPNFLTPEFYQVRGVPSLEKVHHTRIIRFPGRALPWPEMSRTYWWGGSEVNRAFDAIADAEQVIGGVADLITESKIDVYKIQGLHQLLATPEGTAIIQKRVGLADQLKSIYRAIVVDAEEDYQQKESQLVQGMAAIMESYLVNVSAASGIPVTRLLGTSAKGLSATGEGDLRNFYDSIAGKREAFLRPRFDDLDPIFIRSTLGMMPDDFAWEFGPLWQPDEAQVADVRLKRAQRDQIYLQGGVIDEVVVAKQLKADGTYNAIDDDYIEALEATPPEERGGGDSQDPNDPGTDPVGDPGTEPDDDDPTGDPAEK